MNSKIEIKEVNKETQKTVSSLKRNRSALKRALRKRGKIRMWKRKYNGKDYFVLVEEINGKVKQKKVGEDDSELRMFIAQLVLENRLRSLEKNHAIFRAIEGDLVDDSMSGAIEKVLAKYPFLSKELVEESVKKFAIAEDGDAKYTILESMPEDRFGNKKHQTSSGFSVRSKSEVLIAEKLHDFGIEFEYEALLDLEGVRYAPDFLIFTDKGKIFVWEHMGLTNDESYLRHQAQKVERYIQHGIAPWDNLIITFDGKDGSIDVSEIDFRIKQKLLS